MLIFLGNVTPERMAERLGIEMDEADLAWLRRHRQETVNSVDLADEMLHIYDVPFFIMCGRRETAEKVREMLEKYGPDNFKDVIQVGWERET